MQARFFVSVLDIIPRIESSQLHTGSFGKLSPIYLILGDTLNCSCHIALNRQQMGD